MVVKQTKKQNESIDSYSDNLIFLLTNKKIKTVNILPS
jgi:hypothetical protein